MNKPQLKIVNVRGTLACPANGTGEIAVSSDLIPLTSYGDNAQRLRVLSVGMYLAPVVASDDNHLSIVGGGATLDFYDAPGNYLGSFTMVGTPTPNPVMRMSGIGFFGSQEQEIQISAGILSPSNAGGNPSGVVAQVAFSIGYAVANNDASNVRNAVGQLSVLYEITS